MENKYKKEIINEPDNATPQWTEQDIVEKGVRPKHWWRDSIIMIAGSLLGMVAVAIAIDIAFKWLQPQTILGKLLVVLVPIAVGASLFNIIFLGLPDPSDKFKKNITKK